MSFNKHLFSSVSGDWRTPKALYQALDAEFGFDFDPCPVSADFDGLSVEWGSCNYVNPPYGHAIGKWVRKGYEEAQKGKLVVMLLPSRTDTRWWAEYVMQAHEIRLITGRLKFNDGKVGAPFPSCIAIFDGCSVLKSTGPRVVCWHL